MYDLAIDVRRGLPMTTRIKLQISCGEFSDGFIKKLPALETVMIAHGLDPSDFVIAKDASPAPRLPIVYRPGGNPVDYTVFVSGDSFTVTQPDDLSFLAYFYRRCIADTGKDVALHSNENKLGAWFGRLKIWLNKPI